MIRTVLLFFALSISGAVGATVFINRVFVDPINGDRVPCRMFASLSVFPNWEEARYDLTNPWMSHQDGRCFNPRSGYGAFVVDFEDVSPQQAERLRAWLASNYRTPPLPSADELRQICNSQFAMFDQPDTAREDDNAGVERMNPVPPLARWVYSAYVDYCQTTSLRDELSDLVWLEKLYQQRQMPEAFWLEFYRVAAFAHRVKGRHATHLAYVRKALPLLQRQLKASQNRGERLRTLYLLGEYHRRLGDYAAARRYFDAVWNANVFDPDGHIDVTLDSYRTLVLERRRLLPKDDATTASAHDRR